MEREVLAGVVDEDVDWSESVVGLDEELRDISLGVQIGVDWAGRLSRRLA